MNEIQEFYYEPEEGEELSTSVVAAVAKAHDEDILDQEWRISEDINTDALDGLFNESHLKMTLQFEADSTTATITADPSGNQVIKIQSHR